MPIGVRVPDSLWSLVDAGVIGEVLRPLLSGKEAEVFLVSTGGQERVAKVYKEAHLRSFKHRTDYTEGRAGRNSRDRRAIAKRSRHGRAKDEAAWRSAEVEAIYKLRAAGVRVPEPVNYMDGVLVMELVVDADGNPAPRLGELVFEADHAVQIFEHLLQEVVRMLCAGVVHADLSDFNILMSADGPVIIDFPQVVDPANNGAARRLLMRDVDNLQDFLLRFAPGRRRPYAQEMWKLYEASQLTPETQLRGEFRSSQRKANTKEVLGLIDDAKREEQRRRGDQPSRNGRGRGRGSRGQRAQDEQQGSATTPQDEPKTGVRGRWVEVKIDPPPQRSTRSRKASNGSGETQGAGRKGRSNRRGGQSQNRGQNQSRGQNQDRAQNQDRGQNQNRGQGSAPRRAKDGAPATTPRRGKNDPPANDTRRRNRGNSAPADAQRGKSDDPAAEKSQSEGTTRRRRRRRRGKGKKNAASSGGGGPSPQQPPQ